MDSESRVYVAGNTGLVGSAIVRMLHVKGYTNILSSPSSHFDLRQQEDIERFFKFQGVNNLTEFLNENPQVCDFIYEKIKELF